MRRIVTLVLLSCLFVSGHAGRSAAQVRDVKEDRGAATAWQALLRLRTTATVLHTTAHPDDEDAALLTWLARGQGVRTGMLTINRGEGGANLIGPELYDALGVLRTEELLAADRFYGLDAQFFTSMSDFGFSKRLDETIEHWGKENVLREMVRVIRIYRPDVIVSRFHGKARDGHGNHQASGLLSIEAFKAAADQNSFPEQIREGLRAWQVKKLYLSTRPNETSSLKIDVGEYNSLMGQSYREIAMAGYSMHRSQSMGRGRPSPGSSFSSVQLAETVLPRNEKEESLFDGIDTSILGLSRVADGNAALTAELQAINARVESALRRFDARTPWTIATDLAVGARRLRSLIDNVSSYSPGPVQKDHLLFLLKNKDREFNDAMNLALGLHAEVLVDPDNPVEGQMAMFMPRKTFAMAIPGQEFTLTMKIVNRSRVSLTIPAPPKLVAEAGNFSTIDSISSGANTLGYNETSSTRFKVRVADNAKYSRPHWSRASEIRDHKYRFDDPRNAGLPFPPPVLTGVLSYQVDGVTFQISQPAQTSYNVAPLGEQRRLLTIAPAINLTLTPRIGVVALDAASTRYSVTVNVSSNVKGKVVGQLRLQLPAGWKSEPETHPLRFSNEGEEGGFVFQVTIPSVQRKTDYRIQAIAEYGGRSYLEGYRAIAHPDLEPRNLYRPAVMEIKGVDAKVAAGLHVGYVMGVGDEVPSALEQIGVKVSMLGAAELAEGPLDRYDAIVIGIRASAVRPDLKSYNRRLLDYAERGGNLIWQYQTPEFDELAYGPYPYKMGRNPEEVSEEDSRVTILDPEHPVFTWPNRITASDFDGWVEERGSKWLAEWDSRYQPLLECNDRGQAPQRGGLLFARYGKGTFTYAAYAFYRQLPAGVEGAYKLFANLISMSKK